MLILFRNTQKMQMPASNNSTNTNDRVQQELTKIQASGSKQTIILKTVSKKQQKYKAQLQTTQEIKKKIINEIK